MKILFINGSPNKNGNTAALAETLLEGKEYETLNLTDYRIGSYGQTFGDDQLDEIIAKMKEAKEYTMKRFAKLYGMEYAGLAMDKSETKELGKSV